MKITLQEEQILLERLKHIDITSDSLKNEILLFCLNRNLIGISEIIESECELFLTTQKKDSLIITELLDFISSINLEDITLDLKTLK